MFSKMSAIKCEPQNIYIKQEDNIDESTEYNDSNDGEFTFQCYRSVQDSKYTTENVEAQIKTEVDIIDDLIYESFFKKENYNYDPSISMCYTPTTYYIKSKSTNCNLNTKASTINLTPKHKTALYKKKQYFSQIEIKSEKPYKCGICNKSFSLKGTLKTHIWIHKKNKPYKCFICNKSFSQASTLITHKVIHNAEKPFNCDICRKSFAQKVNMKTHMMLHMGEKSNNKTCYKTISLKEFYTKTITDENPYKSVICNKLLSQGTTSSIKQQFKCHICSKLFSYKGTLKTHLIIHTKEKPYKCHICSKSYSYKGTLKTHLIIHTKEKPYKCHICSKSYSQKGYMKIHTRIHTRENP
ncbi:zinc finger protein 254-like [Metopolophium dirhodum]|uniref:zinc finger protein 254-like n=1 Tax=Metopolophium dirhodum TaxID=44670 RepID=UPI00298F84A8|nr:zinc finger protein 254-like [Metopolophium dirhodum]XP_060873509.1 zinc finger protein 254-like [Metopolophium dirhodum]XP_060873510.1 zinc finger protein 254-like [Metopolophium dirhodum]